VLISPHSAFLTTEALASIASMTVANIREFQEGKRLTFEVKPQ
jgi:lactate dehydrogenase-like 2-hydroxyacid dehydrogenase